MTDWLNDIWSVTPHDLLEGVRTVAIEGNVDLPVGRVLDGCQLTKAGSLQPSGRQLYMAAWVKNDSGKAQKILAEALRPVLLIQIIKQELKGFGPVSDDGVLNLLRLHGAVPEGKTLQDLRRVLMWATDLGLLVYSRRNKTVRPISDDPEVATVGEDTRISAVISPQTPMLNVVRLRRILRACRGVVWWADPHFSRRCLEDLIDEVEFGPVTEIRILSGSSPDVLGAKAKADFTRFEAEAAIKGVKSAWHADPLRDWHDRYLADDRVTYNMPPANTLYKGDYTEIQPAVARPPLDLWWQRSVSAF